MIQHRIGVILAAGRGRRMGGSKQLVMWPSTSGPKPLVAAAYDAIVSVCTEMIVVVGHEADAVKNALVGRTFHAVHSDPDAPMFESICVGLRTAQQLDQSARVVIQPGDHPEVAPTTLETLAKFSNALLGKAIIPVFRGRGGHPVFIPPEVAVRVLHAKCSQGLDKFWAAHPELSARITVHDPSVVRDVDTPADLLDSPT
jgi:molybdenum cofactor cytidylyltransferase